MRRSWCVLGLLGQVAAVACGRDSQPEPSPLPDESCLGPWVLVDPISANIAVGDSVGATASRHPIILACSPGTRPVFEWRAQIPAMVQIRPTGDSTAVIKALSAGTLLVYAAIVGQPASGPLANQIAITIR